MDDVQIDPTAGVTVYVDQAAETVEIMFYKDDTDTTGKLVAMNGDLDSFELIKMIAEGFANHHGIGFVVETV